MQEKTLADLKVGDVVFIKEILQNPMLSAMSVLFCGKGEQVEIKRKLAKGTLLCIEVAGSFVGMRSEDARNVIVETKAL